MKSHLKHALLIILTLASLDAHAGWFSPSTPDECIQSVNKGQVWPSARVAANVSCMLINVDGWAEDRNLKSLWGDENLEKTKKSAVCFYSRAIHDQLTDALEVQKALSDCSKSDSSYRWLSGLVKFGEMH